MVLLTFVSFLLRILSMDLTTKQKADLLNFENRVTLGIGHSNYGHMAVIPDAMRQELYRDLI